MQDFSAEDPNDDQLLPMRKRPFGAIDTSEAPAKRAALPETHSRRLTSPGTPLSDRVLMEAVLRHHMQGNCLLLRKLSPQSPVRCTAA